MKPESYNIGILVAALYAKLGGGKIEITEDDLASSPQVEVSIDPTTHNWIIEPMEKKS